MENYLGRRRPIPDPSPVESIAVATWCFGFAIASGRSHWRRRVSSFRMNGEKDRTTRPADTRMLFERARLPRQLWFVPNAGHVDLHRATRVDYESRVLAFLKQM